MTVHLDLLDQHSILLDDTIELVVNDLVDRRSVDCPRCGESGVSQHPVFAGRDGAYERVDFVCDRCGTEHPVWIG